MGLFQRLKDWWRGDAEDDAAQQPEDDLAEREAEADRQRAMQDKRAEREAEEDRRREAVTERARDKANVRKESLGKSPIAEPSPEMEEPARPPESAPLRPGGEPLELGKEGGVVEARPLDPASDVPAESPEPVEIEEPVAPPEPPPEIEIPLAESTGVAPPQPIEPEDTPQRDINLLGEDAALLPPLDPDGTFVSR